MKDRIHYCGFVLGLLLAAGGPLRAAEQDALWLDLADRNAAKAYRAVWALVAGGEQSVRFLEKKLLPVEGNAARLRRLIADLDSDEFAVREAASRELGRLGPAAEPLLRQTLKETRSVEVQSRVNALLSLLTIATPLAATAEELRTIRAIQALEYIGAKEARALLQKLADGMPGARATQDARAALERLSEPQR